MTEVNVAELRQQWDECQRLLDGDRIEERRSQPSEYYHAQFEMLALLWANAPALLDAYERQPIPASWARIIESILARVLAGEPAAQVVADYADEHGHTIEGLEKVERLLAAVAKAVEMRPQSVSLITAYAAIKEPTDGPPPPPKSIEPDTFEKGA